MGDNVRIPVKHKLGVPVCLLLVGVIIISGLMSCGCINPGRLTDSGSFAGLTILVDNPDQMEYVQDLAQKYQNKSGIAVSVKEVPADDTPESDTLIGDLLVADMSRIPVFADDGRLMKLNSCLSTGANLNWTFFERPPLVLAGEFPERSGDIYALPFSPDALGIAYRADLFGDPKVSAAFCRTYGYPIGIPVSG